MFYNFLITFLRRKIYSYMAEKKQKPTPETPVLPKYRERLRGRYADANPQTDQDWDDLAERGYAEDEERIKAFEDNNKVIQDVLDSDKDASAVISDMIINGTPFRAAVAKYFAPEDLVPKEGDDDYEYYQKSVDERKKMGQAFRERSERKKANATEAYDNIDRFAEQNGLGEEEKDGFVTFVNTLYDDLSDLKLSMETLGKLYKAMTYDAAVAEAAEAAERDGKNEAIELKRVRKASDTMGDGVPTPAGGSSPIAPPKPKKHTIFDDIKPRKF